MKYLSLAVNESWPWTARSRSRNERHDAAWRWDNEPQKPLGGGL